MPRRSDAKVAGTSTAARCAKALKATSNARLDAIGEEEPFRREGARRHGDGLLDRHPAAPARPSCARGERGCARRRAPARYRTAAAPPADPASSRRGRLLGGGRSRRDVAIDVLKRARTAARHPVPRERRGDARDDLSRGEARNPGTAPSSVLVFIIVDAKERRTGVSRITPSPAPIPRRCRSRRRRTLHPCSIGRRSGLAPGPATVLVRSRARPRTSTRSSARATSPPSRCAAG